MSIFKNKEAAEKWLLNQCNENIVQKTAIVIVSDQQVCQVDTVKEAQNLLKYTNIYDAFYLRYLNGAVNVKLIQRPKDDTISEFLNSITDFQLINYIRTHRTNISIKD